MKQVIIKFVKKFFVLFFVITFFVFINIYLQTYPSKILGIIIDLLSDIQNNKDKIITNIYILIGSAIAIIIIRVIWKYLTSLVTRTFEKDLRDSLFIHFLKINLSNIQNIKNGEIISHFIKDVNEVKRFGYSIINDGIRVFAVFVITINTMRIVNISLTIAVICPIIVTAIIVIIIRRNIEISYKKSQKYFTKLSEFVQESTDAIRTTKAYSQEEDQIRIFIKKNKLLKKGNFSVDFFSSLLDVTVTLCLGMCYTINLIYGSKLVLNNIISIGDFVAFNGYISLFYWPLYSIARISVRYKRAKISYRRLDKIFKLEEEKILISDEINNTIHGDFKINNLSFNYPEYIDKVLDNINIEIKEGETLGIIGTIGSGKTTLMNLLLRLYKVPDGKIFIGGQDINNIDLVALRKSICYITQDNFLFSTSIKDNISLFQDRFKNSEIEESATKAMLSDDLKEMKEGINTVIGEKGIDLSGGQKQRVVISRAFLNKCNIIIFDDTFSALDNKTEEYLLNNIKKLVAGKTCIIISNRISDVKHANNIIVLDNGKIIESGKHSELLKMKGLYYKFHRQQASKQNELLIENS